MGFLTSPLQPKADFLLENAEKGKIMRNIVFSLLLGSLVGACSSQIDNDPIYQALLANPPVEVPKALLPRVLQRKIGCEVYNQGQPETQHMVCFFPGGSRPVKDATMGYYAPRPLNPPVPSDVQFPGGKPLGLVVIP